MSDVDGSIAVDIFLADPMIRWLTEPLDVSRCKHVYSTQLPFRTAFVEEILNSVFDIFNQRHPADYKHRSLSVGDVVTLNNESSYLCMPLGWQRLQGVLRPQPAELTQQEPILALLGDAPPRP